MLEEIKNISSENNELRRFGIIIGTVLIIISGFLFWKEKEFFQIFLSIGVVVCFFGIVMPVMLKFIYLIWMIFTTILGWIMTRVILSLLFYFIITPIGLFYRLFGKEFLDLHWKREQKTFWNYRLENNNNPSEYENQF